jgi:enterochelin esterase-like enzyme
MLDNLIQNGKIRPIMAVFVQPPNRFKGEMPNRMTEYGLNEKYVDFFCDELVPFIDKTYSTIAEPSARLVCGDSFGGLVSVVYRFRRPEVFGLAYGHVGYYSFQKDSLIHMIANSVEKGGSFPD